MFWINYHDYHDYSDDNDDEKLLYINLYEEKEIRYLYMNEHHVNILYIHNTIQTKIINIITYSNFCYITYIIVTILVKYWPTTSIPFLIFLLVTPFFTIVFFFFLLFSLF